MFGRVINYITVLKTDLNIWISVNSIFVFGEVLVISLLKFTLIAITILLATPHLVDASGSSEKTVIYKQSEGGARLNKKMAAENFKKRRKHRTQSMTLNRARSENAPFNNDGFTIQLFAGSDNNLLIRFLKIYPELSGMVRQTSYRFQSENWATIIYGRYQDEVQARDVINNFPKYIQDLYPWIRSIEP